MIPVTEGKKSARRVWKFQGTVEDPSLNLLLCEGNPLASVLKYSGDQLSLRLEMLMPEMPSLLKFLSFEDQMPTRMKNIERRTGARNAGASLERCFIPARTMDTTKSSKRNP